MYTSEKREGNNASLRPKPPWFRRDGFPACSCLIHQVTAAGGRHLNGADRGRPWRVLGRARGPFSHLLPLCTVGTCSDLEVFRARLFTILVQKKQTKGKGPAPGTSGVTFPQSLQLHTLPGLPIRTSFYPCLRAEHSSLSPSMLT